MGARVDNLEEAMERASSSDIVLFGLSRNISLEHLVKFRARVPSVPVIVLANLDDTVVALRAVREGAQEYLLKGQTSSTLMVRTIRYAIERKRAEEALRYRMEFEKLIATISTHFINISLEQMDRGINRALQAIGEFSGVDRSYLYQFSTQEAGTGYGYEWCREGVEPQLARRRALIGNEFVWSAEKLKHADSIMLSELSDLPLEAGPEKHELEQSGVQSLICIPLIYAGSVVGCLGFETVRAQKDWSEDIVSLLKFAGDMFVNALQRKHAEWELQRSRELLTLYSRATNDVLWDWNLQTNEVWWNENLQRVFGHVAERVQHQWWIDHIHPDDREATVAKVGKIIQSGGTFSAQEYRFRCWDGSYAKVLDRGYVVFNEQKRPVRMVGALMDITERKSPIAENVPAQNPPAPGQA